MINKASEVVRELPISPEAFGLIAFGVFALQPGSQVGKGVVGRLGGLRGAQRAFAEVLLVGVA